MEEINEPLACSGRKRDMSKSSNIQVKNFILYEQKNKDTSINVVSGAERNYLKSQKIDSRGTVIVPEWHSNCY